MKTKTPSAKHTFRDPQYEYALYSDDDGVEMYENENDALVTKRAWIKAGANNVKGPFKMHRSKLDAAAPDLLEALIALVNQPPDNADHYLRAIKDAERAISKCEVK